MSGIGEYLNPPDSTCRPAAGASVSIFRPMHTAWQIVLFRVLAMAGVAAAGWGLRRRGVFTDDHTRTLGRLVVEVSFPALTFGQMLRTVTPETLAAKWLVPVLGLAVLVLAAAVSAILARLLAPPGLRTTFTFLGGTPNWIFLPLPIAQAVYGDTGVQTVLLFNVSTQLFLWTAYVALLRGGLRGAHALRGLLTNAGFLATLAGIALALLVPGAARWAGSPGPAGAVLQGLDLLGSLTVPLSLLITGAQLAGLPAASATPRRLVGWLLAVRLVIAPLLTCPVLALAAGRLSGDVLRTVGLIALMPVAVSCSLFVDKFGGDRDFAARAIGYSTLAAVITVPLLFALL